MVDEDSPHQLRSHAEELCAVLPPDALLIDQFEIRLVHEPRCLQRVTRPLVTEVAGSNAVQLRINAPPAAVSCGNGSGIRARRSSS